MDTSTGSKQQLDRAQGIEVILTGFGKFHGVEENPTSKLMSKLPMYLDKQCLKGVRVQSCSVLHVSGKGSLQDLSKLEFSKESQKSNSVCLLLHLGVDAGCKNIKIESKAYNLADFRCPDENQWQPRKERILMVGVSVVQCILFAGLWL
jgi:pyrrolidone-carboxylate peptidase